MASQVKLFEHPDFDQIIIAAREHFARPGLTEPLIEKDYYVTEALRMVAHARTEGIIFKGGTSLSKGWNLIQRFSEDLDLFIDPGTLGKKAIDRELKQLRDIVGQHPGLEFRQNESTTIGGFGRSDYFRYTPRFTGMTAIAPSVLLEVGTSSGTYPTETRAISSYVAEFLHATGTSLGAEDEAPFDLSLLHFRRTFVEKMFAIHAKVEIFKETGKPIGTYARHYYDLWCLAQQPEVTAMLHSAEYNDIKVDYERVSLASFPKNYRQPIGMRFTQSEALFPPPALAALIGPEYEQQCKTLCYGPYPSWAELQELFDTLREFL